MATKEEKWNRIKKLLMTVIDYLDTSDHFNHDKYAAIFDMWDKEAARGDWKDIDKFCNWCNDPDNPDQLDHSVYIQSKPFEEPSLENVLKGLDYIGVPAEEYVYFRDFGESVENGMPAVRSRYPTPVGYVNVKRMEQMLSKKNRYSADADQRNLKTDQASGDSKVSAYSDAEAYAMIAQGYDKIMDEFYGARSGDEKARMNLAKDISQNGFATLQDVDKGTNLDTKTTLNTLNTYLIASGYRTDLVMNSLKLPYTLAKETGKIKK